MNTIKTAVVTATLLIAGYGAHVTMNKPVSLEPGIWDDMPKVPSNTQPPFEIPPLNPSTGEDQLTAPSQNPFAQPGAYPGTPPSNAGAQIEPPQNDPPNSIPDLPSGSVDPPRSQLPSTNGMANLIPSHDIPGSPSRVSHQAPLSAFDNMWKVGQEQIESGRLSEALNTLTMLYSDSQLTSGQRDQLVPLLDQLAGTVLYSRESYANDALIANGVTTLREIAQSSNLPVEFLARVNGLSPGSVPPSGTQIKILNGPFRARLSLSSRELTLFLGSSYAGRFEVSIGRDFQSIPNTFSVVEKSGPMPYSDQRTQQMIPAGAPNNPLGNHWIGLRNLQTNAVAAIHSSGNAIESSDSRGFIGVSPKDASDLQAILSQGSTVEVVH